MLLCFNYLLDAGPWLSSKCIYIISQAKHCCPCCRDQSLRTPYQQAPIDAWKTTSTNIRFVLSLSVGAGRATPFITATDQWSMFWWFRMQCHNLFVGTEKVMPAWRGFTGKTQDSRCGFTGIHNCRIHGMLVESGSVKRFQTNFYHAEDLGIVTHLIRSHG